VKPKPASSAEPREERSSLDVVSLYRVHARRVAAWAALLGGPNVDPADVVQEVFLIVHRRLESYRRDAAITSWLYGITTNVVRNRRRSAKLRRWFGQPVDEMADQLPAAGPTPIEVLERRRMSAMVYRVLDRMHEKYRAPLMLFEIQGLSGEEIAQLLGLKLPLVWVRLKRAREQFRALLAEEET